MGSAAAKQGDTITATDTHYVQPPSSSPPEPESFDFDGIIDGGLCGSVLIMGKPAATVDSTATNMPPHIAESGAFVNPPENMATIATGSATVKIGGKAAARDGDSADTCDDLGVPQGGTISAGGSVNIG
ncbi:MAG: PAAR domain-containing protein [Clostridiales bacterium]|nr:PAAR domain-containing protein [Clostridiales bacterium]